MAGRIRTEDIEAVRERTDLAKVVGQYLTLKKAGGDSLVGICPFHNEKTPSFSVSPSKQVYYCFGCGAGGDAVRFLQEIESLTFPEAVERLASLAGIKLRYEGESAADRKAASRRASLFEANEEAGRLYHEMLMTGKEGEEARVYVKARGIEQVTAETFGVGYAPAYPDFLLRRMAPKASADLLVEVGLAAKDGEGSVRDRFRGRVVFPIHDLSGRAVGFGGRVLPSADSKMAKYINTSESPVYKKGELLYNLHRAKGAITKSGEAIVVEGYTDVVGLAQVGIENAVATCGTALTEEHLRLLSRFAQRAVLTFDGDEAGARAAERAYAFHENHAIRPVVLILPEGLDPADFVREKGADAFREQAAAARPLVDYMLRRIVGRFDLSSIDGQTQAVDEGLPIVEGLRDEVRQGEYAAMLADLAGVSDEAVLMKLRRRRSQSQGGRRAGSNQQGPEAPGAPGGSQAGGPPKRMSAQDRVEREMLKLLARDADTVKEISGTITKEHFQSDQNRKLFELIMSAKGDLRSLVAASADERLIQMLSQLALEPLEGEPTPEYVRNVSLRLEELLLQRRGGALRQRLQKLNPTTDPAYDELFQELISLDGELRRLRERAPQA